MLDYEWENPSIMLSGGEDRNHHDTHDPTRALSIFEPTHHHTSYNLDHRHIVPPPPPPPTLLPPFYGSQFHHSFYDPRTTTTTPPYSSSDSFYHPHASASALFSFDPPGGTRAGPGSSYNFLVPKTEVDVSRPFDFTSNRIGLNLGGRTYFSAADDDFVSRLYRRSRPGESGTGNSPRCQAEGCNADLSNAKHYHRRHKVCEFHSKASTVVAAGLSQRFCQQCSRFHLLSEFDNGKRSCRKRLADHNRRRRKCHQSASTTPDCTTALKPPAVSDSVGVKSPSNVAPSSTISLDCFRQRQFQTTASSSTSASSSSNSIFFSTA